MRLALLLFLPFLMLGCATAERAADRAEAPPTVADRDAEALVSAERLAAQLEMPTVVVLHVARDEAHYAEGHLPGARFIPLSAVAVNRDDQLNLLPDVAALTESLRAVGVRDGSRVVVYGDFDGLSAARAFFALDVHGVDVAVLDGGREAWQAAGHPLATERLGAPETGPLTLRLDAERVLVADEVNARLDRAGVLIVDARSPAEHSGETPGENITRPGHIPGSANYFWQDDRAEDGTLLPFDELRARYAEAEGREVVVYCRTGVQASHAYLVGRLLGFEPKVYDGSFHDWSNNTDHPVSRF